MDISYFLNLMNEKNASDMFLSTGAPINIKISGSLTPLGSAAMPSGLVKRIAYSMMDEKQVALFERDLEMNLVTQLKDVGRFRVNIFRQRGEIGMVIRAIKSTVPSIAELQLPPVLNELIMEPRGLLLVV
ncbi:MAG: type IV pili twitching motility protein PilT, partial [Rudaea sp.]|nr:type IV pili twitching motility protein PilT [Rudaea sp.]